MNITLNDLTEGQRKSFDRIVELIRNPAKNKHVTINGPAGTGKTTLTKFIVDYLVSAGISGVALAAPTHAAKKILSKLSGVQASTIHSILKINPVTYEENVLFEQKAVPDMATIKVLICDEASMYDSKLFKILMASIPAWCLVIAIGDKQQIRPVEPGSTSTGISPFFIHKDFEQLYLTEIKRNNAPIIDVATDIGAGKWIYEKIVDESGVHDFSSKENPLKDFMMNYFSIVKSPEDLFDNRMMAFTNKSVDKLNSIIRKKLYQTDKPFIVGEVIVMQEPLTKELEFDGKKFNEIIFNNGQYVRIVDATETSTFLKCTGVSTEYMIRYWELEVETNDSDDEYNRAIIKVIFDQEELNKFQFFLAKTADTYKNWSKGGKAPWKSFWDIKRKFTKVKPLPASTFHKTQGMSVKNSFIYTPCIHIADTELAQQLLYVGVTRAKENVYYV